MPLRLDIVQRIFYDQRGGDWGGGVEHYIFMILMQSFVLKLYVVVLEKRQGKKE